MFHHAQVSPRGRPAPGRRSCAIPPFSPRIMNRLLSVAVLGSALILGSCDEASAPEGRDGVVTVRAYVDRDASGTLTEGDSLINGFEASLVRDGEEVGTVTTDEDGVGTSEPLEPGSYEVSIVGGEP